MPWPARFWGGYREPAPQEEEKPEGDIFEEEPADEHAKAVNRYISNLDLSAREQIHMLTEMLDAVVAENNDLKEKLLAKQNELDQERQKKLQSG